METVPGIYDQEIQAVATEEDREAIAAHLLMYSHRYKSSL